MTNVISELCVQLEAVFFGKQLAQPSQHIGHEVVLGAPSYDINDLRQLVATSPSWPRDTLEYHSPIF